MFSIHTKTQTGVFKFLRFEEPFEKLRFRYGLVWTVGLTIEIKLRFQISPAWGWELAQILTISWKNAEILSW